MITKDSLSTVRRELNRSSENSAALLKANHTIIGDLKRAQEENDRLIATCLDHGVQQSIVIQSLEDTTEIEAAPTLTHNPPLHTSNAYSILADECSNDESESSSCDDDEDEAAARLLKRWSKQGAIPKNKDSIRSGGSRERMAKQKSKKLQDAPRGGNRQNLRPSDQPP